MGNRGELHDNEGHIVRQWKRKAWVICQLSYKGWKRNPLMQPGKYTELFFFDEATALSAGHRPCGTCRGEWYAKFKAHWLTANGLALDTSADGMDKLMHAERTSRSGRGIWTRTLNSLPRGVLVTFDESACLWTGSTLRQWTTHGYGDDLWPQASSTSVVLLTPPSIVNAIQAGYEVQIHPSASETDGNLSRSRVR